MEMSYDDYKYVPGLKSYNQYIADYIEIVEQEKIRTCIWQKLLIKLVKKTFATEDLRIDNDQVEKYFSYQKYFPFQLIEWEKFCFVLHNCVFKINGLPRWPDLFIFGGRGLGKNGYISYEDFCLLTPTNGIRNYHIDICANSEDQARTSFEEIYDILEKSEHSKKLKRFFNWTKEEIVNIKTNSKLRARTNNPRGKDSLRTGKVDFDEIHEYENWKNINVFTTGLGKKPHPRRTYASTNGYVRDGVLDSLIEKSEMILKGEMKDNGFLPFICKLDDEKEVEDPKNWEKANPSLPYFPNLMEEILKEYEDYKMNPSINTDFMVKRMNIAKQQNVQAVAKIEDIKMTNREVPDLKKMSCVAGLDLMKRNDFLSASLLFKKDGMYYVISHTWVCKQSADWSRIRAPLQEWEAMNLLTIVDEVEINPRLAVDWLQEMSTIYRIEKVAADSYRYTLIREALESGGFTDVKMLRPSDIMRIATMVESIFLSHSVVWGNNPLLRWATNNTKMVPTVNNNYKFDKIEPKSRKNDPFMSFVHAFAIADEYLFETKELVFMDPITI